MGDSKTHHPFILFFYANAHPYEYIAPCQFILYIYKIVNTWKYVKFKHVLEYVECKLGLLIFRYVKKCFDGLNDKDISQLPIVIL